MECGDILESKINRSDYKILVVDDVVSNVLLLKTLLASEKFQICTASNGYECIEKTKSERPDLILLDVMMPELDGFDTATILKKIPKHQIFRLFSLLHSIHLHILYVDSRSVRATSLPNHSTGMS